MHPFIGSVKWHHHPSYMITSLLLRARLLRVLRRRRKLPRQTLEHFRIFKMSKETTSEE